jgi:tetratricopeptide (TPR) repeat protein
MRRRAAIAGCCVALGLASGCGGIRLRRDRANDSPAAIAQRQQASLEATEAMDHNDYGHARAILEKLVAQTPRSAELHYRLGKVEQVQGDLPASEASYLRALAFDRQYVGALVGLGQIDYRLNRPGPALKRFDEALEIEPRQAEAHLARGLSLEALGRKGDAMAAYFRALELDPGSTAAIIRVATLQLDRGQPDLALVRLNQAYEAAPDDPEVRLARGLALLASKRPSPAVVDLEFAAEKLPDRADVLLGLAQALEADRKPDRARQALERAIRLEPDSPVARELTERLLRR